MARILITGTGGFIGFFVAKKLLECGHTVIGVDNFNDYYYPGLKRARAAVLEAEANFLPAEGDISDLEFVVDVFGKYGPEKVLHLAAQAGVRYSLVNPHSYQKSNLEGFLNLMEEARKLPVERFVYASSSSVYGGNTKMPYSETDPVNTPVSLYAATKRANELMAYTYNHLWGLPTIGLRFFTVYGPWGRPDMAYWSFLENILRGEPIRIFNHGRNRRDFTYIDDIVGGVVSALESTGLDSYEIINLGNNNPVELMDFVRTLEELSGKAAVKEMVEAQPGDVVATYADIDRAKDKLGFDPATSFREGLESFVKWYLDHPDLTESVRKFRSSRG